VGAPALGVAQESAASEPNERTNSPRAILIIRGREGDSGQKGLGGTLVWTPLQSSVISFQLAVFRGLRLAGHDFPSPYEQRDTEENAVNGEERKAVFADPLQEPLYDA